MKLAKLFLLFFICLIEADEHNYQLLSALEKIQEIITNDSRIPHNYLTNLANELSPILNPTETLKWLTLGDNQNASDKCSNYTYIALESVLSEVERKLSYGFNLEAFEEVTDLLRDPDEFIYDVLTQPPNSISTICVNQTLNYISNMTTAWAENFEMTLASNPNITEELLHDVVQSMQGQLFNPIKSMLPTEQSIFKSWLRSGKQNISDACISEVWFLMKHIKEPWVAQMFDSWGKPEPGVLTGNGEWVGDYDSCLKIQVKNDGTLNGDFRTQYCKGGGHLIPGVQKVYGTIHLCMPKSCTSGDVTAIIKKVSSIISPKHNMFDWAYCKKSVDDFTLPTAAHAAAVIICILVAACCLATVIELMLQMKQWVIVTLLGVPESSYEALGATQPQPSLAERVILSFSLYSNSKKIMNSKQPPGAITCINGIRFLSMTWVVVGHVLLFYTLGKMKNKKFVLDLAKRTSFEVILNATFCVDSFFVVSALLVSYLFLKDFHKRKIGFVQFLKSIPMIYLQRYLRLTPAYGAIIIIWASLAFFVGSGPFWPDYPSFDRNCEKNWYLNLLYVNNIFDLDKMCTGWGWYLAHDFQFFLIAPFILYLFYRHTKPGMVVAMLMTIGSIVATVFVENHQKNPFTMDRGPAKNNFSKTWDNATTHYPLYFVPWTRYQSYGIGLIAGMVLWKLQHHKIRIHPVINLLMWGVSAALCASVIYGPYDANIGGHIVYLYEAILYKSLSRTAWSIGVSYVIIACSLGQGGWINEFLSWSAFVPLSKLSYCTYLIHLPVLFYLGASKRGYEIYTEFTIINDCFFILLSALLLSFPFSLIFEMPWVNLDKIFLVPHSIKKYRQSDIAQRKSLSDIVVGDN